MKFKKLLPTIIIFVAVLAIAAYSIAVSIAKKPTITEHEFNFSITYELNGETKVINDVYKVHYNGNSGYTDSKTRTYEGEIIGINEGSRTFTIQEDKDGRIELNTNFFPDYMMGDPEYDYFEDGDTFEPEFLYYDLEEIEYTDEETLLAQGIKLISFEYPTPIKNSFVFSHISILDSKVVFPSLFIGLLALVMTVIFVKKEENYKSRTIDVVSTVLNFIILFTAVPFFAVVGCLFDVMGDNEHITNQVCYFISSFTVLCIAASVSLRRKGYGKSALLVQFIGPAIFALIMIIEVILGLL